MILRRPLTDFTLEVTYYLRDQPSAEDFHNYSGYAITAMTILDPFGQKLAEIDPRSKLFAALASALVFPDD